VIVVNPPWTLQNQLQALLPFFATTLGSQGQGSYRLELLVEE
jgi:23S rRNA (adenine2030-N6)-methyltransferase